jgi:hypothetical protein
MPRALISLSLAVFGSLANQVMTKSVHALNKETPTGTIVIFCVAMIRLHIKKFGFNRSMSKLFNYKIPQNDHHSGL